AGPERQRLPVDRGFVGETDLALELRQAPAVEQDVMEAGDEEERFRAEADDRSAQERRVVEPEAFLAIVLQERLAAALLLRLAEPRPVVHPELEAHVRMDELQRSGESFPHERGAQDG